MFNEMDNHLLLNMLYQLIILFIFNFPLAIPYKRSLKEMTNYVLSSTNYLNIMNDQINFKTH